MEEHNTEKEQKKSNWKIMGIIIATVGIILIIYIFAIGFGSNTRDDDVSLSKIEAKAEDGPVVLFFWGAGCSYCEQQKPVMNDLEDDYSGQNVTFYWLDVNNHDKISDEYDVYGVPTTVVLDKDGVEEKFVGFTEYDRIEKAINQALEAY